jgi:HK97 family phage major capsid protein
MVANAPQATERTLTPIDRIEAIKAEIDALSTEVEAIIQGALDAGRELTETEQARVLEVVGENHDGQAEGCLQRGLYDELSNWTTVQNGITTRANARANTTPPAANTSLITELVGNRNSFPMGCNKPVLIKAADRRGHQELAKVGDAWGTTRSEREENAYAAGMWFLAHVYSQHPDACQTPIVAKATSWCREHGILNQQDTVTSGKGPELIPAPLESAIIEIREMYGVMRRFARMYPMSSKTLDIPKFVSGLSVGLVAELAAQVLTEKTWTQVNLVAKKAGGFAQWSTEVGEDAIISLAADLSRDFGIAFALREDFTGFTGDGVADFANMGITGIIDTLHANATHTLGAGSTAVTDIALSDYEIMLGMITNTMVDLRWFCSKSVYYASIHPLKTAAGGNTIATLSDGDPLTAGSDFRWLGVEGVWTNVLPASSAAAGTAGVVILGDLSQGVAFGDRRGVTVQVSNDIKIIEDAVVMTANSRFDIQTHTTGENADQRVIVQLSLAAV